MYNDNSRNRENITTQESIDSCGIDLIGSILSKEPRDRTKEDLAMIVPYINKVDFFKDINDK